MRIEINNWGPIENCEYDLDKALIVTYGENNIGKSYAMQVMYLLLKNMKAYVMGNYYVRLNYVEYETQKDLIEEIVKNFVLNDNCVSKDITKEVVHFYTKNLEKSLLQDFESSLKNTFGNFDEIIEQKPVVTLYLDEDSKYTFLLAENKMLIDVNLKKILLKKSSSEFHKSRDYKEHFDIYVYNNHIKNPVHLIEEKIVEMQIAFARRVEKRMQDVYFLPASRSGIYTGMSSFGPIMAQLSQNRAYFNKSFHIPSISEPISDYYMALSTIRASKNKRLEEVVDEMESSILKGKVEFDSTKKALLYRGDSTEQVYEMNDVSSMVSEISPIIAYLKYIIRSNSYRMKVTEKEVLRPASIIFIEEPEAHLHPINQIKLMKSFIKLTKFNIKLVIASHSNYIFNELNNRVLAEELDKETYSPMFMELKNGKSNTNYMKMDDLGVTDSNFADAAEMLYSEREELILKLTEKWENENQ